MFAMFLRLYHLIVKEFLATLRDPKARGVLIVPPLLQIFVFSYAITQEVKNVTLAVFNQDAGVEGDSLVRQFQHSPTFTKILNLTHREEINPAIDSQKALAVLVIPQEFSQELAAGRPSQVQILLDGRKSNSSAIVGGYVTKIVNQFSQEHAVNAAAMSLDVETRHWFNVNLEQRKSTIPCLVCLLATILGMFITGLSIAREREMGTFEQILVSPLTPTEILLGKAIPALILSWIASIVLVIIAITILGIPFEGSFFLLFVSLVLFLLSVIGVGLFVSSLSMTQQQAILGVILILPASVMLSGFATPLENMPEWLQWGTVINPIRWYMVIVKGVFMKGMGAYDVFLNCIPLALISIVTLYSAAVMFRKRME